MGTSDTENESGNTNKKTRKMRRMQTRDKDRKVYTDDWNLGDEELDGQRSFNLEEKINSAMFTAGFVQEMEGKDFDLAWVQENGFSTPLVFHSKENLGINVPPPTFTVNDVRLAVGSRRMLDVMDVRTQKNLEMTMKEWQQYYEDPNKDRLLNVISLEFSHTRLEKLVVAPTVVRQIDWVDRVWPRHLKELQTESTNVLDDMMYPKVQKYCLMSAQRCFTDFHIDFGGTSVWYHVLRGSKIFWLIPPTEQNVQLYENWVLSGKQSDVFFGDTVAQCGRIQLKPGDTFFIPTGWIHAVYTPADSLVFGGNFLHSFAIEKQLKIARVEDQTRVQQKYRYPFFTEMLWYVLERYVHCLLGRSHLMLGFGDATDAASTEQEVMDKPHVHLTPFELHGLKAIVLYLHSQPASRKCVPELIRDPIRLIGDVRRLVEQHRFDCPKLAVTGQPTLAWPDNGQELRLMLQGYVKTAEEDLDLVASPKRGVGRPRTSGSGGASSVRRAPPAKGSVPKKDRRRRVRCKECEGCTRDECKQCAACRDMPKYGGSGIIKQSCKMRVCQKPQLPFTAVCCFCNLTGWGRPLSPVGGKRTKPETSSSLFECRSCFKIAHIACTAREVKTSTEGRVLESLPNCWTCPVCVDNGAESSLTPLLGLVPVPGGIKRRPDAATPSLTPSGARRGRPPGRPKKVRLDEAGEPLPAVALVGVPASEIVPAEQRLWLPPGTAAAGDGEEVKREQQPAEQPSERRPAEHGKVVRQVRPSVEDPTSAASSPAPPKLEPEEPLTAPRSVDSAAEEPPRPELSPEGPPPPPSAAQEQVPASGEGASAAASAPSSSSADAAAAQPAEAHTQTQSGPTRIPTLSNLYEYVQSRSRRQLRLPLYPVRPLPMDEEEEETADPRLRHEVLVAVFSHLPRAQLLNCLLVCKVWATAAVDRRLWRRLSAAHRRCTEHTLQYILRRQPEQLELSWSQLSGPQLGWLVGRLPFLRRLSLRGLAFATVAALRQPCCALLHQLDISHVEGVTDGRLQELLSPPAEARPGCTDASSRLRLLQELSLAGAAITDAALATVADRLPQLQRLDVSGCVRLTAAGLQALTGASQLRCLDLSGCRGVTELTGLAECSQLQEVVAREGTPVTAAEADKLTQQNGAKVILSDVDAGDK